MKYIFKLLIFMTVFSYGISFAQEQTSDNNLDYLRPGVSQFMIRGYAHSGLEYLEPEDNLSFVGGAFNPLFIFRQSDRLLFESELEFHFEGNVLSLGLEYANISYLLNDYITIRAGKIFMPFGIFIERLHPAWVNKFPTMPLGFGHDGVLPGTDVGFEARGAFYTGPLKMNYALFILNGPQLIESGEQAGMLVYDKLNDNNFQKTIGGRIGIFPLANSSLELGFSGNYGKVGSSDTPYEEVASRMFALDLSFIKQASFLKSVIDIKAQANLVDVDDIAFAVPGDTTNSFFYDFENETSSYFAQFTIRPSFVGSGLIRNLEFNARYSYLDSPDRALWGLSQSQWDVGINYWLDWRSVLKITYRFGPDAGTGGHGEGHADELGGHGSGGNAFFIHWAIGF